MPLVSVPQLIPGQRVAAPVTGAGGIVLVQTGAELTQATIDRLGELGIAGVLVVGDAQDPAVLAARTAEVEARFEGHERDPWMMALEAIVIGQLAGEEPGVPGS
jgi:hypothetical protein